jgi:hypothetical protein
MPPVREPWVTISSLPKGASYEEMLTFFGIPPHGPEQLDENIGGKRRVWHAKTNSGNPGGRAKAKEVEELIQRLSQALKRGVLDSEGGGASAEIPDAVFETIDELWRIISEYVFADDYEQALLVAREAVNRPGMSTKAATVLAWVISTGFSNRAFAHPSLLAEGMQAAETAVREQPGEARNWESRVGLLIASSQPQDAIAALGEAEKNLNGHMTGMLHLMRVRVAIGLGQAEEAMLSAVRAVHTARHAAGVVTAVRSEATDLLVTWVAANLLPIKSVADLKRYVEMVDVAAWCSYGIPEAEDQVRVHRMWAANAGQRVFTGSWKLRSFLAVCTGFISLPIHNYVRSSPAWQVFSEGLGKEEITESFAIVASPQYVQRAHNMKLPVEFRDI